MNNQYCPNCDSPMVEGESVDVEENTAHQQMHCSNCGHAYTDNYVLTSQVDHTDEE